MQVFKEEKVIHLKIVYAGEALCGKTTNLQQTFSRLRPEQRLTKEIIELKTDLDGILKYEFALFNIGQINNYSIHFSVYTVPGQVHYEASRRVILKGCDGLVFIADSQRGMGDGNLLALRETQRHLLSENIKMFEDIPVVFQFNKQDLDDIVPEEVMKQMLIHEENIPHFLAEAINGIGVIETFQEILKLTVANISTKLKVT